MPEFGTLRKGGRTAVMAGSLVLACSTALCGTSSAAPSEPDRGLANICKQVACRTETRTITLNAPNDNVARFSTDLLPYTYKGAIVIYPGESFAVRMRVHGKRLDEPVFEVNSEGRPVPAPTGHRPDVEKRALQDTEATPVDALVYLSFKQVEGTNMRLEVVSALPVSLKYDAVMRVATPNGIQTGPTSSCPVLSGTAGVENWPVPLTMLALSNFRVVEPGSIGCQ